MIKSSVSPIASVSPQAPADRAKEFNLIRELNAEQLKANPGDSEFEAVANSYELAGRMQLAAPAVSDLSKETKATRDLTYFFWKGDSRPLHQTIDSILAQGPVAIASSILRFRSRIACSTAVFASS